MAPVIACILAAAPFSPSLCFAKPAGAEIVIVAYGDSLTAGFELPPGESFPAQLQKALREKGHNLRVINAGVSGDTAADGLARLDWALPEKADAVILELGGNDALRGIDPKETQKALDQILVKLKERGLAVLLAGMEAPRNMGPDYIKAFAALYPALAEKHGALLYPFFLDGIALQPKFNLADGIHPNPEGIAAIVERILPAVVKLIEQAKTSSAPAPIR